MPRISALETIATTDDADQLPVNDVSAVTTKKITLGGLVAWLQAKVGWITTAMLANAAVTTPKFKPSVINYLPASSGTVNTTSITMVDVPGISTTYTTGPTAERLMIECAAMTIVNGAAGHVTLNINGVDMPDEFVYNNATSYWLRQSKTYFYDAPANTLLTLKFRYRQENAAFNVTVHLDTIYRPTIRGISISNA